MGLDELSRDQIVQLKQSMLEEVLGEEPSWYDLAMADDIVSDEKLEELILWRAISSSLARYKR